MNKERRRQWKRPYCVYVLKDPETGLYKIGESQNPLRRHEYLQRKMERPLEIRGIEIGTDQYLDYAFRDLGSHNRPLESECDGWTEWYADCKQVRKIISSIRNGVHLEWITQWKYSGKDLRAMELHEAATLQRKYDEELESRAKALDNQQ